MTTTQLTLSESETRAVQAISVVKGKTPEEVVYEAIKQFLAQHELDYRLAALRQARGMWKSRQDLPDYDELRNEWNRF